MKKKSTIKAATVLNKQWKEFIEKNTDCTAYNYDIIKERLKEEKYNLEDREELYEKFLNDYMICEAVIDETYKDSKPDYITIYDPVIFRSEEIRQKTIADCYEKLSQAKAAIKEMNKLKKEFEEKRKAFMEDCSRNMSIEQVKEYIDRYNTKYREPAAVVSNTWKYYDNMGRCGHTSATITIGKKKEKPLNRCELPDWRPIGYCTCRTDGVPRYMGGDFSYSFAIQSWDDVLNNLSEYDNQTMYIFKHPIQ